MFFVIFIGEQSIFGEKRVKIFVLNFSWTLTRPNRRRGELFSAYQEKNLLKAKQDIDFELKKLSTAKLRFMTLDFQPTPVYYKEIGAIAVDIPESLYVTDSAYSIETVNCKKFTFIPLRAAEEIEAANSQGFNLRKNYLIGMAFTFRLLERQSSGLSSSGSNKPYAELKLLEFITLSGISVKKFEGN